ncbi:MAG: tetratricopeptide repeat protein [Rhodospirillales bacterium]|nr:tetratricopeptide repeat protein [Rhodospirillales bacterium]
MTQSPPPDELLAEAGRLFHAGQEPAAAARCRALLDQHPAHVEARHLLGVIAVRRGDFADAVSHLERAAALRPEDARIAGNLGRAWMGLHAPDRAVAAHRAALATGPATADGLNELATALGEAGERAAAEAAYRHALSLAPGHAPARYNLGRLLAAEARTEEALEALHAVLAVLPPDSPRRDDVLAALVTALADADRMEEVVALCRRERARGGARPAAAWNESLALLCLGRWREAWPLYESRWDVPAHERPDRPTTVLDLAAVQNRHVLILGEQGRGDVLQFARYAPLVAARGARVTLQVYPDLVPVLHGLPGVRVLSTEAAAPVADVVTPLLSLPLAFGTTPETIPAPVPYLHVPADRRTAWRGRVGRRRQWRIGLAWRGLQHIPERTLPVTALAPLLRVEGCSFHVLQKDVSDEDATWLDASGVVLHDDDLVDFADTAALAERMDRVVTIDTSVAHLAGGLGLPGWVLLPAVADWRWGRGGTTSPWYPTLRLARQPARGDWAPAVAAVAAALRAEIHHAPAGPVGAA